MKKMILISSLLILLAASYSNVFAGRITSLSKSPLRTTDVFFVVWMSEQPGLTASIQLETASGTILYSTTASQDEFYGTFETRLNDIIPGLVDGKYIVRVLLHGEQSPFAELYVVTAPILPISPLSGVVSSLSMSWTPGAPYYHVVVSDQEVSILENTDGTYSATGLNVVWQTITPDLNVTYGTASTVLDVTHPPLLPGRKYSWIVFKNFTGHAATSAFIFSPVSIITAAGTKTSPIAMLSPSIGQEITTTLTLSCAPQQGATRYDFFIYKKSVNLGNDSGDFDASGLIYSTSSTQSSITLAAASCLTTPGEYLVEALAYVGATLYATAKIPFTFLSSVPTGLVRMYVRDAMTASVVPTTEIIVTASGYSPHSYYTDNNGYLELELPLGDYLITACHPHYISLSKPLLLTDESVQVYELNSLPYRVVTTVTDSQGLPVSNASVSLYRDGTWLSTHISDSNGVCEFSTAHGNYTIQIGKSGYDDATRDFSVLSDTSLHVSLSSFSVVTLTLTTTTGIAIPGAQIYTIQNNVPVLYGSTSNAGTIAVPTRVTLWIVAQGMVSASTQLQTAATMRLTAATTAMRLTIHTLQGSSLQRGIVYYRNSTTGMTGATFFNATSMCEIGFDAGAYDLITYATNGSDFYVSTMHRLTSSTLSSLRIAVEPAVYHDVRVLDVSGVGLQGSTISSWHASAITDSNGYARIPVNKNTYSLYNCSHTSFYSTAFGIVGSDTKTIILQPVVDTIVIRGTYMYSDFVPHLVIATTSQGAIYSAPITPSGYALSIPPGTYTIDAVRYLGETNAPRILSAPPSAGTLFVSQLPIPAKYSSYTSQCIDANDLKPLSARIQFEEAFTRYYTYASSSGLAALFAQNPASIIASHDGYSNKDISWPPPDTISLHMGHRLAFTLQDETGNPVSGAIITYSGKTVTTSTMGKAELYAPAGVLEYTITHPERIPVTRTVTLPDISTVTHTLFKAMCQYTLQITATTGSAIDVKIGTAATTLIAENPFTTYTVLLPYGQYALRVSASNHMPVTKTVTLSTSDVTETMSLTHVAYPVTVTADPCTYPSTLELTTASERRILTITQFPFTTPALSNETWSARIYSDATYYTPESITFNPKDTSSLHFTGFAVTTEQVIFIQSATEALSAVRVSFTTTDGTYIRTTSATGECRIPARYDTSVTAESLTPGVYLTQSSFIAQSEPVTLLAGTSFASLLLQSDVSCEATVYSIATNDVIYQGSVPASVPVIHGDTYRITATAMGYISEDVECVINAPSTTYHLSFSRAAIDSLMITASAMIARTAPLCLDVFALTATGRTFYTPYTYTISPARAGTLALQEARLIYHPAEDYLGPVTIAVRAKNSPHRAEIILMREAILSATSPVKKFYIADTDVEIGNMNTTATTPFTLSLRQKPNQYRSFAPKNSIIGTTLYAVDASSPLVIYSPIEIRALHESQWYEPEKNTSLIAQYTYTYTPGHFFATAVRANQFSVSSVRVMKNPYSPRSGDPMQLFARITSPRSAVVTVTATLLDSVMRPKYAPVVDVYALGDVIIRIPIPSNVSTGRYYLQLDVTDGVETARQYILVHCIR